MKFTTYIPRKIAKYEMLVRMMCQYRVISGRGYTRRRGAEAGGRSLSLLGQNHRTMTIFIILKN